MALENSGSHSGRYITDLDSNNPAATDPLAQADEHLRYIKGILNNSFGSITGAVTATHTQINNKCAEPLSAITSDGANPAVVSLGTNVTQASLKTLIGVDGLPDPAIVNNAGTISIASTATEANVWNAIKNEAFKTIYPVGSIYVSVDSTDPTNLFGGTWSAIGEGQVLVGHSGTDSDFNAATPSQGGAKTATASITVPRDGWGNEQTGNLLTEPTPEGRLITGDGNSDNQNFSNLATASGDRTLTGSVSTLQPYIAVYMWKRTVL
tara:strand:+ start:6539 stop:7336 length:798 start_codon:yes stop_codon:yes gene_type:complete